jgi:chemotaxis protein methyltransferase CheR
MSSPREESVPPGPAIGDEVLTALAEAVGELAGLQFPAGKRRDLRSRLAPLLAEVDDPAGLPARIRLDPALRQAVLNRLTIGESYFFRNHPHFDALRRTILPDLETRRRDRRRLAIWCAGCATGEEPYSLALLLDEHFPHLDGWDISIVGTDINTDFLDRAAQGIYPPWSFRGVERRIIDRYFEPAGERRLRLVDALRRRVSFEQSNLGRVPLPRVPDGGPFDVLLCRNVLIYFAHDLADAVVRELMGNVARDGYLLVGHAEAFPSLRELEAVYSDATYFYRNARPEGRRHAGPAAPRTFTVPGLPVAAVDSAPPPAAAATPAPRPAPARRRSTVPPPPPAPDAELARVREHIDRGELGSARTLLGALLDGPAGVDFRGHFLAALLSDLEGRPAEALASLRQSIFLNRRFVIGHYYQGVICEREGDRREAVRCLRNAARLIDELPAGARLEESGGIAAPRLREIVEERIKELEIDSGTPVPGAGARR